VVALERGPMSVRGPPVRLDDHALVVPREVHHVAVDHRVDVRAREARVADDREEAPLERRPRRGGDARREDVGAIELLLRDALEHERLGAEPVDVGRAGQVAQRAQRRGDAEAVDHAGLGLHPRGVDPQTGPRPRSPARHRDLGERRHRGDEAVQRRGGPVA
jgi:hypothetical protein